MCVYVRSAITTFHLQSAILLDVPQYLLSLILPSISVGDQHSIHCNMFCGINCVVSFICTYTSRRLGALLYIFSYGCLFCGLLPFVRACLFLFSMSGFFFASSLAFKVSRKVKNYGFVRLRMRISHRFLSTVVVAQ